MRTVRLSTHLVRLVAMSSQYTGHRTLMQVPSTTRLQPGWAGRQASQAICSGAGAFYKKTTTLACARLSNARSELEGSEGKRFQQRGGEIRGVESVTRFRKPSATPQRAIRKARYTQEGSAAMAPKKMLEEEEKDHDPAHVSVPDVCRRSKQDGVRARVPSLDQHAQSAAPGASDRIPCAKPETAQEITVIR